MNDRIDSPSGDMTPQTPRNWRTLAACLQYDPELWFADDGMSKAKAARICRDECPVLAECLAAAKAAEGGRFARGRYGIYAGLDPEQRYALYMRDHRAARRERAAS
jgi:transcription factor WhiB